MATSRISFHGTLRTSELDSVLAILRGWLRDDTLEAKLRLSGYEIAHEAEGFEMFCQEASGGGGTPRYLLEGSMEATQEAAAERLRPLLQLSADRGVDFSLEYVPVDEDGGEAGDEVSLE